MTELRLAKFLAQTGTSSRRRAEEIIAQGRVTVNGVRVCEQGVQIEPDKDLVEVDGSPIETGSRIYLLLNKPAGYICSMIDPQRRPTVASLVEGLGSRIYPIGRLDFETEGLLLMTNDGDFANLIAHPRYGIRKRYQARVKGRITQEAVTSLKRGVELEDGTTAPAGVKVLAREPETSLIEMEIGEGKKREVRRMCAAVGFPVIHLQRTALSFLNLEGVPPGEYRLLNSQEVQRLRDEALKSN